MSPAYSTNRSDWLIVGESSAWLVLPGRWVRDKIQWRVLLPALLCLCLSGDLFVSNAKQASQSERTEMSDQLKRALARRAADGVFRFGGVATALGRHELAAKLYTSAHALAVAGYGPDSTVATTAIILRAGSLSALGRLEQALRDKDRVVELAKPPMAALAYASRAVTLIGLERYPEALRDYESSLRMDSTSFSVNIGHAILLRRLGRLEEARDAYSKVLDIKSDSAAGYSLRGHVSHELKDYWAAINDYTRAIRLQPSSIRHYNRGLSYRAAGAYDLAVADYSRALEFDARNAAAFYSRGNAYLQLEKYDLARADYTRVIELNGTDVSAYVNRAIAYGKLNRVDKALADYDEALRINRNHVNTYANRGWLYEQLDRSDLARLDYARALSLAPDDAWLRRALARVS
jgi:tetratricopeptide (TPR) repeat protein